MGDKFSTEFFFDHFNLEYSHHCHELNKLVYKTDYEKWSLIDIHRDKAPKISDYAGSLLNHDFFWECVGYYRAETFPRGKAGRLIENSFGTYQNMQSAFLSACMNMDNPGWGWLVVDGDNKVHVMTTENSSNPVISGADFVPLLNIDLWEHAYYPLWRDDKEGYIKEFFHIINWDNVNRKITTPREINFEKYGDYKYKAPPQPVTSSQETEEEDDMPEHYQQLHHQSEE